MLTQLFLSLFFRYIFKSLLSLFRRSNKRLRSTFQTERILTLIAALLFGRFVGTLNCLLVKVYKQYIFDTIFDLISEISQMHCSILLKRLRYQYFLKAVANFNLQRIPVFKYIFLCQSRRQYHLSQVLLILILKALNNNIK